MSILEKILASKRAEVDALRRRRWTAPWDPRPLRLDDHGWPAVLAEIKLASPSAGRLSSALTVAHRALCYELNGAQMISVLCDGPFFGGSYSHLTEARNASRLPLLCKEFIVDEVQLDAALHHGADAVLLIVRCLRGGELERLIEAARHRRLTPLVEVSAVAEASRALDAGATTIGVNARDLDTLQLDRGRALRILQGLPRDVTRLALSGVQDRRDVQRAFRAGASGVLVGEALMRQDDPSALLRAICSAPPDPVPGFD